MNAGLPGRTKVELRPIPLNLSLSHTHTHTHLQPPLTGSSICGVTAIVSLAPAIGATDKETAIAVANVVAFGLFGMLTYPYLAHACLDSPGAVGLFLGTAVHDTSQVVGAALTYSQLYSDPAVVKVHAASLLLQ